MKTGYVYILSNKNRTTLYVGATSNIEQRIWQHRTGHYEKAFSKKYNLHHLLYFETLPTVAQALTREKQLKLASRLEMEPDKRTKPRTKRPRGRLVYLMQL